MRIISLLMLAFLFGCKTNPAGNYQALNFSAYPEIKLDAKEMKVENQFQPTYAFPDADHLSPISPSAALEQWAKERLVANGDGQKKVKFLIKNASIKETKADKSEKLFNTEPIGNYRITLDASIQVFDKDPLFPFSEVTANSEIMKEIPANASVEDREKILYDITKQAVNNLVENLYQNSKLYFGNLFIY